MTPLTLPNIIETLSLLKQANCSDCIPLAELAKELKTTKSDLMRFINRHPDLFITAAPNPKAYKGRNPGLLVFDAFATAEENYTRPEFLARLQEKTRMTVRVSEYGAYGCVQGYYVAEDKKYRDGMGQEAPDKADHRKNTHLWRNTAEKLARLDATGHTRKGYFWDRTEGRTQIKYDHIVTVDDLRALKAEGWSLTGELPDGI